MSNPVPLKSIGWGFGVCNMHCKHCYGASSSRAEEHTFTELAAIADKICPTITDINYGTGEFIFNPNAVELARYIARNYPNVKQAVTTNGATAIMMDPAEVKRIFHDIDISIDFPDPERHNDFRQHPRAWDWVERSLKICKELGIEASIVTCVTSQTSDDDIKEFLELADKHQASWRTNWFRKTGRGKSKLQLTPYRFWQIIKLLAEQGITFESISDPLIANILGNAEKNPVAGCSCGRLSCRIQTDLSVTPCVYLKGEKWAAGSIAEKTLDEIYTSVLFSQIRDRYPDLCKDCRFGEQCRGGCASRAFLHLGDLRQPDDYCPYAASDIAVMDLVHQILDIQLKVTPGTDKVHDGYLCTMIVKP